MTSPSPSRSPTPSAKLSSSQDNYYMRSLPEDTQALLQRLEEETRHWPLPPPDVNEAQGDAASEGTVETVQQFYEWHARTADEQSAHVLEYRALEQRLLPPVAECEELLKEVATAETTLKAIRERQTNIATLADDFHGVSVQLLTDTQRAEAFAASLEEQLKYFDDYDRLAAIFGKLSDKATALSEDELVTHMTRVDECLAFLQSHSHYMEAELFALKYRQLQQRGLGHMRSLLVNAWKEQCDNARALVAPLLGALTQPSPSDGDGRKTKEAYSLSVEELTHYFLTHLSKAPRLRPLCAHLELNADEWREYANVLRDCVRSYLAVRSQLLSPRLIRVVVGVDATSFSEWVKPACDLLVIVSTREHELFHAQFIHDAPEFFAHVQGIASPIVDHIRAHVLSLTALDELTMLNDLLRNDILSKELAAYGDRGAALRSVLGRLVEDIQERLIFVASLFVRDEIAAFVATPEDLAYPEKIIECSSCTKIPALSLSRASAVNPAVASVRPQSERAYYAPPLRRTIDILARLYLTIDNESFDDVALQATRACIASLQRMTAQMKEIKGTLDSQLFLISHLLILAAHLRPFDVNFVATETSLDFSSIVSAVRALLTGQKSLFSFSRDNALYSLLASSAPRVKTSTIDYKQEQEALLERCIDALIEHFSALVLDSMRDYLTQSAPIVNAAMRGAATPSVGKLSDQPFATPQIVTAIIEDFDKKLTGTLPLFVGKLGVYIQDDIEQERIFKRLKLAVMESVKKLKQILNREYQGVATINSAIITLLDDSRLHKLMDGSRLSASNSSVSQRGNNNR